MTALTWSETALVSSTPLFLMTILVFWKLKEIDRPAGEAQGASLSTRYIDGARLLLRDAQFLRLCIMAGLWSMSQNGTMFFIPLYLVGYMDASAAEVGLVMAAIQLGAMITGPFAGAWSDRVGRRPVVLLLLIVGAVTIAILPFVGTIVAFTVVASFFGCAIYSIRPVMHSWTMDLAGAQTSGSAVSMVFAFQSAMTVSIPILGGIAADIWGITVVFYIMTITCVGAAILVFSMPNIHAKKDV
jgi:MFS family permease